VRKQHGLLLLEQEITDFHQHPFDKKRIVFNIFLNLNGNLSKQRKNQLQKGLSEESSDNCGK
jgi:hypothetical protein